MKRITQQEKVLRALIQGEKVTRMTMFYMGVGNGPEVIRRLREQGVAIMTKEVNEMSREGFPIRYGSYHLKDAEIALKTLKTIIKE